MSLWLFSFFLILYFSLHSLLADAKFKSFVTNRLLSKKYYRLVYNLVAVGLLIPLVLAYFRLETYKLITAGWVIIPGMAMVIAGIAWVWKAMESYDLSEFIGTYQWNHGHQPEHTRLITSGLNRKVRHPLYFGTLLLVWGAFLCLPDNASLVIAVIATAYLYIGTLLEEKKLKQQFGESYRFYQ